MSLRLQISDGMMRSLFHVTPTADPRPYLRLVDPVPLHSTPMDEASGVQVPLGTQYVSQSSEIYLIPLDKLSPLRPPEVYTTTTSCVAAWCDHSHKSVVAFTRLSEVVCQTSYQAAKRRLKT